MKGKKITMTTKGYHEKMKECRGDYHNVYPLAIGIIGELAFRKEPISNKARLREIRRVYAALGMMELI